MYLLGPNSESDLASYKVYGGTSSNPTTLLSTVSAGTQTYTQHSWSNGTLYYYRITALDNGNETTFTSDVPSLPHVIDGNYSLAHLMYNDYVNLGTKLFIIYKILRFQLGLNQHGEVIMEMLEFIFSVIKTDMVYFYMVMKGGSVLRFSIEKPSGSV